MSIQQNYGNIKPSLNLDFANTKQLDPRITYSRASTGTYYDGKTVAKAEENLVTFSEQFDNASWTVGGSTVTANASTAPDGTTTADKLVSSATTGEQRIYRGAGVSTTASQVYTYSVYAKSDTVPFVIFRDDFGGYGDTSFNISSGTVGTVASGRTATITSVGNGWYRCSVTATSSLATQQLMFCLASADNGRTSFTGNGTSGVLLWGAQLEQRSFATAYTPTTTAPITNYIPVLQTASAGTPRFDHNPVTGESLGLLIEEQRTNLCLYSEQFDNAAWSKARASISANATAAPDGTTTADKLVEDTSASNTHQAFRSTSVSAGTPHTFSVYVKADGRNFVGVRYENSGSTEFYQVNVNLTNGTATTASVGSPTGTSFSVTSAGNAWWRVSVTTTTSNTGFQSVVYLQSVQGSNNYTGNGFSGVYIWGAQLEAGAFATSYIPTVASQVTRAADSASMTGTNFSSWYNPSEGTLFAQASQPTIFNSSRTAASVNDNSIQRFNIYRQAAGGINGFVTPGSGAIIPGVAALANTQWKAALAYTPTTGYVATNNSVIQSSVVSGAHTISLGVLNNLCIGNISTVASEHFCGTIARIAYYPRRLTNTQIQALTS